MLMRGFTVSARQSGHIYKRLSNKKGQAMRRFSSEGRPPVIKTALRAVAPPVRGLAQAGATASQVWLFKAVTTSSAAANALCAEPHLPPARAIIIRLLSTRFWALFWRYQALWSCYAKAFYNIPPGGWRRNITGGHHQVPQEHKGEKDQFFLLHSLGALGGSPLPPRRASDHYNGSTGH
jgi:hypothetical protein